MLLKELSLRHFRNYDHLSLKLHPGVNLFVGENGQGKTNLVEAVYFLLRGSSFRPGAQDVLLQRGALRPQASLRADIMRKTLSHRLAVQIIEKKKIVTLDNKPTTFAKVSSLYPTVLFSPESLASIKEGPEARRVLVDEFLVTQGEQKGKTVSEFRRSLQMRNRILKNGLNGLYSTEQTKEIISALDEIYLPLAAKLAHERVLALRTLLPFMQEAMRLIAPKDLVDISVDYVISDHSAVDWELYEILDSLRNRLKSLRNSELAGGQSLVGAHKHEIRFLSAGNDARYFSSQGQQRALILGFKMAQIMYHYQAFKIHPVLLLDDVLSELDATKGANLLKFLEGIRSQIFLTTTDISFPFDFSTSGLKVFRLSSGQVESLRV